MNRLAILYGCVLLTSSAIAEEQQSSFEIKDLPTVVAYEEVAVSSSDKLDEASLILSDIKFIEEEEIELGFQTSDYLPEGFDPHKVYFDLNSVEFIGDGQEFDLGFDSSNYLPEGFDPYNDTIGATSINYMKDEEVNLGFDTMDYLPEGFSPFEPYLDLDSIPYIEIDDLEDEEASISIPNNQISLASKPCN